MFLLKDDVWEIKPTGKKGRGIFAKKDIPAGIVIGDYIGKVVHESEEDKYDNGKHSYLMYYHAKASIAPDPKNPGIHLINHSCSPNAWMHTYYGHTLYFALRHIFPGEEITVSYLLDPQDKDCNPCAHLCHCNSMICTGTMHLTEKRYRKWEAFDDVMEKKTKRQRVKKYNVNLPLLPSYPENIADNPIYTLMGYTEVSPQEREDTKTPSIEELRKNIRESGKTLAFQNLNLHVFGIWDEKIIAKPLR